MTRRRRLHLGARALQAGAAVAPLAGNRDQILAFVMAGAALTAINGYRLVWRRSAPVFEPRFDLPTNTRTDRPLILGAALFGIVEKKRKVIEKERADAKAAKVAEAEQRLREVYENLHKRFGEAPISDQSFAEDVTSA